MLRIAKRRGKKRATVALARKLAVVMHGAWSSGQPYKGQAGSDLPDRASRSETADTVAKSVDPTSCNIDCVSTNDTAAIPRSRCRRAQTKEMQSGINSKGRDAALLLWSLVLTSPCERKSRDPESMA